MSTWVKVHDTFPDHPKVVALTDAALACWLRGLCYSSRHLTDGAVPKAALRHLGKPAAARELVSAGLWVATATGWQIHDYTAHQRTKDEVQTERDGAKERARLSRARRAERAAPSQRTCDEVTEPEVEAVSDTPPQPPAERGEPHRGQHANCRGCGTTRRPPRPPGMVASVPRSIQEVIADRPAVDPALNLAGVAELRRKLHPVPEVK